MGLSGKWLEIARRVGVEMWIDIWKILDRENLHAESGTDPIRVKVPRFSRLQRYQRNQLIYDLHAAGRSEKDIHAEIHRAGLAPICMHSIKMIVKGQKNGK